MGKEANFAGVDACINETIELMKCTTGRSKASGCPAAFLAMRECNRTGGKHLVTEGGSYAIAPGKHSLFDSLAMGQVSSSPPVRTLQGMQEFGAEYAKSLGI